MQATFAEGTLFAGRYRLLRRIATGGMGTIYEAVHVETERRRAVKVMHAHLFQSDDMRDRFKREARIASQIESEHIVDVSDAGVDDASGVPFLVMELLRGEDLGARLKRLGRLPPEEVLVHLQQAASALDLMHRASVVHRDLKPENLFLSHRDGAAPRLKILDFGIAKIVAESATAAGATESLGTPLYMAPEQFHLGAPITPAVDVFALGMMAFTLLVGASYWRREAGAAGNAVSFALAAAHGPREPASARAAAMGVALPPGFDAWFSRATAPDPAARFPSAGEAVRWLAPALDAARVSSTMPISVAAPWAPPAPQSSPLSAAAPLPSSPVPAPPAGSLPAAPGPLEQMTTSSAAVTSFRPERRRSPAIAIALIGGGAALLAAAVWWALHSTAATAPSGALTPAAPADGPSAALTGAPSPAPSLTSTAVAPTPSAEPSSSAIPAPTAEPAPTAGPSPAASAAATATSKTNQRTGKPPGGVRTAPTSNNPSLFGRD